ncbi:small ubiquitin-related modifier [Gloeopeniophorella convolvens]|nr:small ubiquitin-related modifier [Gloeopeniophorella convolvens]
MSDDQPSQPEVTPKTEDGPNAPITVKIVSNTGYEIFFKITRSTKLSKVQSAYAIRFGKDVSSIRFLYDGTRINDDDTPSSLNMQDDDAIDVMAEHAVAG